MFETVRLQYNPSDFQNPTHASAFDNLCEQFHNKVAVKLPLISLNTVVVTATAPKYTKKVSYQIDGVSVITIDMYWDSNYGYMFKIYVGRAESSCVFVSRIGYSDIETSNSELSFSYREDYFQMKQGSPLNGFPTSIQGTYSILACSGIFRMQPYDKIVAINTATKGMTSFFSGILQAKYNLLSSGNPLAYVTAPQSSTKYGNNDITYMKAQFKAPNGEIFESDSIYTILAPANFYETNFYSDVDGNDYYISKDDKVLMLKI